MACYIISFEVSLSLQDKLVERIKAYGSYCPINAHCWAIKTEHKAPAIRNYLKEGFSATDRVIVVRSGTEAAWWNSYGEKHDAWLKANL
jgi:hypothetical protein